MSLVSHIVRSSEPSGTVAAAIAATEAAAAEQAKLYGLSDGMVHLMHLYGDCTRYTCPITWSFWGYLPSIPANILFLVLFATAMVAFCVQLPLYKKHWFFTTAMIVGCLVEVIGYIGRILSGSNPWNEGAFLAQMVALSIAPSFYAAGIYVCLSQIVEVFGVQNSRIPAKWYPIVFVACDCVSLFFQGVGGIVASVLTHKQRNPEPGNNVMLAGMTSQIFTMMIFMGLAIDFGIHTYMRFRMMGDAAFDKANEALRKSKRFTGFIIALGLATILVFLRCIYRAAELGEGWTGHLIYTQSYFIILEGIPIMASALLLAAFHPGFCLKGRVVSTAEDKVPLNDEVESIITAYSDEHRIAHANKRGRKYGLGGGDLEKDLELGFATPEQCNIQLVEAQPDRWKLQVKAARPDQWKIQVVATAPERWNIILTAV